MGFVQNFSGLVKESANKQIQALTSCFSCETLKIVQPHWCRKAAITYAIKQYIDGHINKSVERRNFRCWIQQPRESFDDFLMSLQELVKSCKFCSDTCIQKNLRYQIIKGPLDGDSPVTRKKILPWTRLLIKAVNNSMPALPATTMKLWQNHKHHMSPSIQLSPLKTDQNTS